MELGLCAHKKYKFHSQFCVNVAKVRTSVEIEFSSSMAHPLNGAEAYDCGIADGNHNGCIVSV